MFFLSDLQKIFIRKFKVSSASEEDDEEEHDDGYVYYRWRIQLKFINAQGATLQSEPFVEKVTFELHPDFDTPRRVFKKPPYLVKEVGWGGFEIPITIHFARGSPIEKFETTFLLNLPADKKPQTFEMKFINPNPEFLILLNQNHTPPGSNTSGTTSSKTISKSPALLVARNRSKSMPTTNNSSLPRPVNAHPSITNNYDQGDEDADGVIDSDAEEEDLRSTQTEVFDVGGGVGVSISRLVEQMERARGEKALRLAQKLDELIEDIPSETRSVLIRSGK